MVQCQRDSPQVLIGRGENAIVLPEESVSSLRCSRRIFCCLGGVVGSMLFDACGVVDFFVLNPFNFDFFLLYDGESHVASFRGMATDK